DVRTSNTHRIQHYPKYYKHTTTTKKNTISLHDALPISQKLQKMSKYPRRHPPYHFILIVVKMFFNAAGSPLIIFSANYMVKRERSEEHTSELQSRENLVCRLLLEKNMNAE